MPERNASKNRRRRGYEPSQQGRASASSAHSGEPRDASETRSSPFSRTGSTGAREAAAARAFEAEYRRRVTEALDGPRHFHSQQAAVQTAQQQARSFSPSREDATASSSNEWYDQSAHPGPRRHQGQMHAGSAATSVAAQRGTPAQDDRRVYQDQYAQQVAIAQQQQYVRQAALAQQHAQQRPLAQQQQQRLERLWAGAQPVTTSHAGGWFQEEGQAGEPMYIPGYDDEEQ